MGACPDTYYLKVKLVNKWIDDEISLALSQAKAEIFVSGLLLEEELQLNKELTMQQRAELLTYLAEDAISEYVEFLVQSKPYMMDMLNEELRNLRYDIISKMRQDFPEDIPSTMSNADIDNILKSTLDKEILTILTKD